MDQDLGLLKHWVLDEKKFVTSVYLLRNTDLNVSQVERLLNTFLEENVANDKVSATYFVLGVLIGESDGILRKKSVICKKEDLDACKSKFTSIDACTIYSVQAKPVEEFQALFNASWLDTRTYMSPSTDKTLIKNSSAIINYQKWKESHQDDEYRMEQASARALFNDKVKSETKLKESEENSRRIDQLFKKSVKTTPKKEESNSSSANQRQPSKSPSPERKKSKKKIIVESDDDDVMEEDGNTAASSALASSSKKLVPVELKLDNDDLFCTEDSGSEKGDDPFADVDQLEEEEKAKEAVTKRSKKQNGSVSAVRQGSGGKKKAGGAATQKKRGKRVVLIGRHSSDEEGSNSDAGDEKMEVDNENPLPESIMDKLRQKGASTSGTVKQEERKVTESFVDEDGFLVTQTVMKPITKANVGSVENRASNGVAAAPALNMKKVKSELADSETVETKPHVLKPSNGGKSATAASKRRGANSAKQPSAGQKTISSFFGKK